MGGRPSIWKFLIAELTRNYVLEYDLEQYAARREKIYSFMRIPKEVEKFMFFGMLQCVDTFLYVYTLLPIRVILAIFSIISRIFSFCFISRCRYKLFLKPGEVCDILKAIILIACTSLMSYVDVSVMYHLIKSQSVIKLYLFYNMLEVGDRLFSTLGQDVIDSLLWTATASKNSEKTRAGIIPHHLSAIVYVYLHSLLVLCQATILNVAINSNNGALLTIMISNNFVELKGSVFKKFDKNNLFQVSCYDVRERFHLCVLHSIVILLTMKEYNWDGAQLLQLLICCFQVLFSEVCIDWVKHAFIIRFNELQIDIYKDYTYSLAYDLAQTRQKNAFIDHSDLVARRLGFIPLPLGVVMIHVLKHTIILSNVSDYVLVSVGYICLLSFKILNNIYVLGRGCDLIEQHQEEKDKKMCAEQNAAAKIVRRSNSTDTATTPTHPSKILSRRPVSIDCVSVSRKEKLQKSTEMPPLGSPAIFSNSNVDLSEVSLNDEILETKKIGQKLESIGESENESFSRSEPNIQDDTSINNNSGNNLMISNDNNLSKKRAESEPSILDSMPS